MQCLMYSGLPEPVPLDGNVVLWSTFSFPYNNCFFCIYLCQTGDCTHHPGKRTEQNHFIEHYSHCAFFFSFFLPLPHTPNPSSLSHSRVQRFKNFLNLSPSKNRENAVSWEQLAVRKAFLKQLPGNIVLTDIPDVTLSFSVLLF